MSPSTRVASLCLVALCLVPFAAGTPSQCSLLFVVDDGLKHSRRMLNLNEAALRHMLQQTLDEEEDDADVSLAMQPEMEGPVMPPEPDAGDGESEGLVGIGRKLLTLQETHGRLLHQDFDADDAMAPAPPPGMGAGDDGPDLSDVTTAASDPPMPEEPSPSPATLPPADPVPPVNPPSTVDVNGPEMETPAPMDSDGDMPPEPMPMMMADTPTSS